MCGIFGLILKRGDLRAGRLFRDLFILSESRGKEASGFAVKSNGDIKVFKTPLPASKLVKGRIFRKEFGSSLKDKFIGMGHSRLVTNGYEQFDLNNQPVVKEGMVVIHNGIIVNQRQLWETFKKEERISDLDSELIPSLVNRELTGGIEIGEALGSLFKMISGMANIAMLSTNYNNLILATNNGSIHYVNDLKNGIFIFASERFILEKLIRKHKLAFDKGLICQLNPGKLININLNFLTFQLTTIGDELISFEKQPLTANITFLKEEISPENIYVNTSLEHKVTEVSNSFLEEYIKRRESISHLKRCSKCILPETFPFIKFDAEGICNYCNNYKKIDSLGKSALLKIADNYRRNDGKPECLVPFSGGRDSSYALHYVVKDLGLKPIAFSYDWGMLTDLARRNQARMCGSLGVEHILVSADIRRKRENIRKNVLAWLKRPDLGTIPLFMAGDKQYFYYANLLMKQNNLNLSVLGENLLETTNFKSGFCGIRPKFDKGNTYSLGISDKIRMITYYGIQYLLNPAYLNSSLFDTLDSFKAYYIIKHSNLNIYDYLNWDEQLITETIINDYAWETDPGTETTWRIGDGTAAFYNYIYYMVSGFTENDTFRSNQIREGVFTREKAISISITENQPRWDSIQWYCRTIGIDFEKTIYSVNNILRRFK